MVAEPADSTVYSQTRRSKLHAVRYAAAQVTGDPTSAALVIGGWRWGNWNKKMVVLSPLFRIFFQHWSSVC